MRWSLDGYVDHMAFAPSALFAVLLLGEPFAATAVDLRQTTAPPDLILLNGSIYTVDAAQPRAEACTRHGS